MPSTSPELLLRRPAIVTVLVDREIAGRAQGGPSTSTSSLGLARTASHSSIDAWWDRHGAAEAAAVERILNRVRAPLKPGIGSRSEPSIPRATSPHSESREAAFLEKFSNKSTSDVLQWLSENRVRNTRGENELPPSNLFKKCFYDEKEFLSFVHRPYVTADKAETTRHSWPPSTQKCTHNGTGKDKSAKQALTTLDVQEAPDGNDVDRRTPRRSTNVRRAKRHKTQVDRLKQLGILMHDDSDGGNSSHGDIMDSSSYGSDDSASLNAHSIRPPIVRSMVIPQTQTRPADDGADSGQLSSTAVHNARNAGLPKRDYIPRDVPSSASSASSSGSSASSDSTSEPEESERTAPPSPKSPGTGQTTPAATGKSNRQAKPAAKPKSRKQKPVEHPRAAERRQARLNKAKENQLKSIYTSKTTTPGATKTSKPGARSKQSTRDGLMSPFTKRTLTGIEVGAATGPHQARATPSLQHIREDPLDDDGGGGDDGEEAANDVFGVQGAFIAGEESLKSRKHRGRQRKEREPRRRRRARDPSAVAAAATKASRGNDSSSGGDDVDDRRRAGKERAAVAVDSDDDAAAKRNMKLLEDKLRQKAERQLKEKSRRDSKQKAATGSKAQGKVAESPAHKQSKAKDSKQQGNAGKNPSKKPGKNRLGTRPSKLATVPEQGTDVEAAAEQDVSVASQTLDTADADVTKAGKSGKKATDRSPAAKAKASVVATRSSGKKKSSSSATSSSSSSSKQLQGDLAVNSKAADFSSGRLTEGGGAGTRELSGAAQVEASSQKAGSKGRKKPAAPPTVSSQQRRRQQLSKVANAGGGSRGRFPSNSSGPSPTSSTIATIRARDVRSRGIAVDDDIMMTQNPQIVKYERPCDDKPPVVKVTKRPKLAALKVKAPVKKPKEPASAPAKELERQKTLSSLAAMLVQDNNRVRHPDTFRMREKGKPRVAYIPQISGAEKNGNGTRSDGPNGRVPLSDMELNELQPLPSIKEVESVKRIKEAFQRRGKEKMEQRFKQLMRLAKRELGHQYGVEYRRASGFDQLAQFCIVVDSKLELYARAFAVEDDDEDGILNEEQLLSALESLHTISHVSPQQLDYVLKVLECEPSINFKQFAVIAALCERIGTLDKDTRMFLDGLNLASIERKMAFYKQLFIGSSESMAGKTINADDLRIELKAGGLPREMENHIVDRCDEENSGAISFLDYMAYIPLFVQMHESIVDNPFDSFADAFGLASSCSAASSECTTATTATTQYRRESIVVDVVRRSPHSRRRGDSGGGNVPEEAPSANQSRSSRSRSRSPSSSRDGRRVTPVSRILVSPSARLAMLQEAQERKQRLRATHERAHSPGTAAAEREESAAEGDPVTNPAGPAMDVIGAHSNASEYKSAHSTDEVLESESQCTGQEHTRADSEPIQSPAGNPASSLNESEERDDAELVASAVCILDEREADAACVVSSDRSGDSERPERRPLRAAHAASLGDIADVEVAVSRSQSREARPLPTEPPPLQDIPTSSSSSGTHGNPIAELPASAEQTGGGSPPSPSSSNECSTCPSAAPPCSTATDATATATSQLSQVDTDATTTATATSQADTVHEGGDTTGKEGGGGKLAGGAWRKGKRASQKYVRRRKWSDESGSPDGTARQAEGAPVAALDVAADNVVAAGRQDPEDASVGVETARHVTSGGQTREPGQAAEPSPGPQRSSTVTGSDQQRRQPDIGRPANGPPRNDDVDTAAARWQRQQRELVLSIAEQPIALRIMRTPSSSSHSGAGAPTARYRGTTRRWSGSDSESPTRRRPAQRKAKKTGARRQRHARRSNSDSDDDDDDDDGGGGRKLSPARQRRKAAAGRRRESSDDDDEPAALATARRRGRAAAPAPSSDRDDAGPAPAAARRRTNGAKKGAARRRSSSEGSPAEASAAAATVPQQSTKKRGAKEARPERREESNDTLVPTKRKDLAAASQHKSGGGALTSLRPNSNSGRESGGDVARRKTPANRKAPMHRHKQGASSAASGSDAPPARTQRDHRVKKRQKARKRAKHHDDSSDA